MGSTAALVVGMLATGAANSIFSKAQDRVCVHDCATSHPKTFEQPVYQTLTMFVGEMACLLALQLATRNPFKAQHKRYYEHIKAKLKSNPLDSGIAIDDSLVVPVRVAPTTQAPRAVHGATEAPIVHSVDVDALELYGEAELTGWRQALFFLPALFDLTATTLMNVGLLFTPVSIYQMTRSALVLFVGAFSVVYLGRRLNRTEVLSLCVVTLGVFIVGLSGAKASDATAAETEGVSRVVGGILLILFAQLFTAAQFVVEEKIMSRYAVEPLRAVGLEGVFGFGTTLTLMVAMFFLVGRNEAGMGGPFDVRVGFREIVENREVWLSSLAICLSIGLFNFFGLAVTKTVSATARSTIDCSRTVLIWFVSLYLGWETFKWLQLLGFGVLVYGTFVFNGIASFPGLPNSHALPEGSKSRETTPLLQEE